jgi:multidrug resistance protein, MATE family
MAGRRPSETTALLNNAAIDDLRKSVEQDDHRLYGSAAEEEALLPKSPELETTWQKELRLVARYSGPLAITYALQYSYSFVTVFVAGRLGVVPLGAASLANLMVNVTGLCIYEGLATTLDTLASQAFGAGRKDLVGLHVQRMVLLVCVVTIPIGALWLASPWILPPLIPEKAEAELACTYIRIYLLGAPGYAIFEAGKRFCQAQGDFTGSLFVVLICAPLNIFWNWLFVFHLGLGFSGAGLALVVSNNLQPLVLLFYVRFVNPSTLQCWPGLQWRRAFENWGPMIRLSIPGVLMTFSEWFAFDIMTIAAGYISSSALAAQSVCMTIAVVMFHIPFPFSIAASTRFGNLIGYGALDAARTAWRTYYCMFVCIGAFDVILLTSCRKILAAFFTSDERVQAIITAVMPVVAATQFFDAFVALANGLLRGMGRQKIGGYINLGVYYLFALPVAFFLSFGPAKLGLTGMWVGPGMGLAAAAIMMSIYMWTTDWSKAVEDARAREESG